MVMEQFKQMTLTVTGSTVGKATTKSKDIKDTCNFNHFTQSKEINECVAPESYSTFKGKPAMLQIPCIKSSD